MSGDEQKRSPPRQEAGGGREATGDGPVSILILWPPPSPVNEDCDYAVAGPDRLMGVFAADYYELRALRRHRERVTP